MRLRLLLFLFLFAGFLTAQEDTIRTLIITEAHLGSPGRNFVEISNVGTTPIQMSNFEVGRSGNNAYSPGAGTFMMLPERVLDPGESFLIAVVHDFSGKNARALGLEHYTNPEPSQIAQIRTGSGWKDTGVQLNGSSHTRPEGGKID
jgi:hypothetical protein